MKLESAFYRHSRESGNPFFSQASKTSMDSRFRGNDGDGRFLLS